MREIITTLIAAIPFLVSSQVTTLKVNVDDCKGPADGSISVYYHTTMIAQQALVNGSAEMELDKTVGLGRIKDPVISVYPNPSTDGGVMFDMEGIDPESAKIEYFNLLGQQLGIIEGGETGPLHISAARGIVLYIIKLNGYALKSGRIYTSSAELQIEARFSPGGTIETVNSGPGKKKSGDDDYIVVYKDPGFKILRQDTVTIPEGSQRTLDWVVCAEEDWLYSNPGGLDHLSDIRGEGRSTLGGSATWTWYGGGSNSDRHMYIYFDKGVVNSIGNKVKLTIRYKAGNITPGINTGNNTPNAFRVGLFNNHGKEVYAGLGVSNVQFSGYTGYYGGFSVKESNAPGIFERITGQNSLILGNAGSLLGTGTQSGNMANAQERTLVFSVERTVSANKISLYQDGNNATFDFYQYDTLGLVDTLNTIVLGFDDDPELLDWVYINYITVEYTNYTPIIYYNLNVSGGSGSGTFREGSSAEIHADAPAEGKTFDRWTGDTSTVEDVTKPVTTVIINSDINLTATYRDLVYSNLTVNSGSGSGILAEGSIRLISADPAPPGKVFDRWTGDVDAVTGYNGAITTVEMPAEPVTITATYRDGDHIIPVPVEVMGLPPHVEGVNFDLGATGAEDAHKLFIQVHNIAYYKKGRLRVNGGEWLNMTNDNPVIDMYEPDKSYGGFGGGFATVRFTIDKSHLEFRDSLNTVEFEYNHKAAPTAGYRVIRIKVLDGNGDNLISPGTYIEDDPATWEPPLDTPEDIAAGENIWTSADLGIKAHCMDCHTRDGRDLKYFNVSNKTIIEQCKKSDFTEEEGKQVASYIRSLDSYAPAQARVWNPPYQPGPGTDSKPVWEWAAGASIDAVLDSDEEMLPYIFGDGSKQAIDKVTDTDSNLNLREIPVAVQFPDWLSWIPEQHPMDIFDDWDGGDANVAYNTLLNQFKNQDLANSANLISSVEQFHKKVMWWVGPAPLQTGHPWTELGGTRLDPVKAKGMTAEWAKFNLSKWHAMKMWEMMNMFDAEDKAQAINPLADKYQWPSNQFGTFQIAAHFIGDDRGTSAFKWETLPVGTYFSSIWYELQMVLCSGMRTSNSVQPVDWAYNHYHINRLGERTGIYEPLRLLRNIIKGWQMRDTPGKTTIDIGTWTMREVSPWRLYSDHKGDTTTYSYLNKYQPGLRTRATNSMLESWLRKSNEYPVSAWPRTNEITYGSDVWYKLEYADYDPTGKENPGNGAGKLFAPDGAFDAVEAHAFWRFIPRFQEDGVDPHVVSELAKWADKIWTNPNTDWEQWFE